MFSWHNMLSVKIQHDYAFLYSTCNTRRFKRRKQFHIDIFTRSSSDAMHNKYLFFNLGQHIGNIWSIYWTVGLWFYMRMLILTFLLSISRTFWKCHYDNTFSINIAKMFSKFGIFFIALFSCATLGMTFLLELFASLLNIFMPE